MQFAKLWLALFPSTREAWPEPGAVLVLMEHGCVEMKGVTHLYREQFVKVFYAQLYVGTPTHL